MAAKINAMGEYMHVYHTQLGVMCSKAYPIGEGVGAYLLLAHYHRLRTDHT
jgi:hypothetical protein